MSRVKHRPMTVHEKATNECINNGHTIGIGVYQFDSDGFTWGDVCLCAPGRRQICETCAKPWPCVESELP